MPPQAPPQQSGAEHALDPIWMVVALFLFAGILWYVARVPIISGIIHLKIWELELIKFFAHKAALLQAQLRAISPVTYPQLTFNDLGNLCDQVGTYLRYPLGALLIIGAVLVYFNNAALRFKQTYTMQQLLQAEEKNWPQVLPVVKLNLIETPLDEGPWAMAMTPIQYAKQQNLLQEERILQGAYALTQKAKITASVLHNEAQRVFTLQVGRYWEGPYALPIHTRALFAIFAARTNGDRASSSRLLTQISNSSLSGKLDFSGVDRLIDLHAKNKLVVRATQKHAFVYTVMATMLMLSRSDGVLAAADFLWLKPVDRTLWYMLNTIGRQTPFVEVAGPYAHWIAELQFGHAIRTPMVGTAVTALEMAVKEMVFRSADDV